MNNQLLITTFGLAFGELNTPSCVDTPWILSTMLLIDFLGWKIRLLLLECESLHKIIIETVTPDEKFKNV